VDRCGEHGNLLWPAGRPFPADAHTPYCHACWRAGGGGTPARSLPCVHEGPVLEFAACGSELRHVRDCERFEEPCTRGLSRVRSCQTCPEYSSGRREIHFFLSAHGIGDAVGGVYAACGLAEAGYAAVFHCRHPEWVAGVSHPGVTVQPWRRDVGHDANADYGGQLAAGSRSDGSRVRWYCDQLARQAGIAPFAPARPQTVAKPARVIEGDYVLLAPFSHGKAREWPLHKWAELGRRLSGRRIVAVGTRKDRDRLEGAFRTVAGVTWYWGQPPGWVVSAVAHAEHVYANDSGPAHLAGLHNVPCTAVTAHLPGSFLFAEAPSVSAVSPDWPCSPCGWRAERGYRRGCQGACPALAALGSERIPLPAVEASR